MRDAIAAKRSRRLMLVAVGLLAAVAVLPLLVPPSALAYRLALEATEISSAKVCGASECRELSDPEAATALAVGPAPGVRTPPCAGCPGTRARSRSAPRRAARWTRLRHRGALRRADARGGQGGLGDPAQREQRGLREAHSRAYAPPGEDASGRGRGRAAGRPRRRGRRAPSAATPASDGSNVWIVALGGGVLAALMAGLLLTIRHRRASTPPAASEAPG